MNFRRRLRTRTVLGSAAFGLLAFASEGVAQTPMDPASQSRNDELERQVRALIESLQKRDATPPPTLTIDANVINAIVDQRIQQVQAGQAAAATSTAATSTAPASPSAILGAPTDAPSGDGTCCPPASTGPAK
jgi:hypothetical protein